MFSENKSLGGNHWKLIDVDERKAELISQRYDLPFIVSRIITSRGVHHEDVDNFIFNKIDWMARA